jgi:hypothetical protein
MAGSFPERKLQLVRALKGNGEVVEASRKKPRTAVPGPPGQGRPSALWFLHRLIETDFGLFSGAANGGGAVFFAHVGGFT